MTYENETNEAETATLGAWEFAVMMIQVFATVAGILLPGDDTAKKI